MGHMLLRDMDDDTKQRLRERAAVNGRSMNMEAQEILRAAVGTANTRNLALRAELDAFRAKLAGRHHTPSEELVRESRDVDAR